MHAHIEYQYIGIQKWQELANKGNILHKWKKMKTYVIKWKSFANKAHRNRGNVVKEMKVILLQMKWRCYDEGDKGVGRCVNKAT